MFLTRSLSRRTCDQFHNRWHNGVGVGSARGAGRLFVFLGVWIAFSGDRARNQCRSHDRTPLRQGRFVNCCFDAVLIEPKKTNSQLPQIVAVRADRQFSGSTESVRCMSTQRRRRGVGRLLSHGN
jgi:hypothetical protein